MVARSPSSTIFPMRTTFTCRALLFDLDGTLVDSGARVRRLWEWWAETRGIDFQRLAPIILGRTAIETIRLAAPDLVAEKEMEALESQEVADMRDVSAFPGAMELLNRLNGAKWAIVTSGSDRVANARIRHVALPAPPVLVTASHIERGKPAPDAFLLAARHLGVERQDCIVVEDAPVGIAAGKAAGMQVVAVASTHPAAKLRQADAVISGLADLQVEKHGALITLSTPGNNPDSPAV